MWRGTATKLDDGSNELRTLDERFGERPFEDADRFRIRLRGVMVREDMDPFLKGDNDLLVATSYRFGNEPPVDRLHFLEKGVDLGWQGDFFDEVVFATNDLRDQRLRLHVQVYDVDDFELPFVESPAEIAQRLAGGAALTFPQLAPLTPLAEVGADAIVTLVNHVDDNDRIVDDRVTLERSEAGTGHNLLQPGYVVCFRDDVDGHLALGPNLRVHRNGSEYEGGSYAVFEFDRKFEPQEKRTLNQKAAKLISEINGRGPSGESPLHYLRETMAAYTAYKKLKRVQDLEALDSERTEQQNRRLKELREDPDLEPYLKNG